MAPAVPLSSLGPERVGFGVSLVGGGARVQVFERSICAQNAIHLVVSISTSRLRPNLSPRRGCPVSSGSLAPRPPAQMGRAA